MGIKRNSVNRKNVSGVILALAVVLAACVLMAQSVTAADIASGSGDSVKWVIDANGVLTISPINGTSGIMDEPDSYGGPWRQYRNQIKKIVIADGVSAPESMDTLFQKLSECESITGNLDTSEVVSMNMVFQQCGKLTDISSLSSWDTETVESMSFMFFGCSELNDISALAGWDTGNVASMYSTFAESGISDTAALSGWDTGSVTGMDEMFRACDNLSDISSLAGWNTENVQIMSEMFSGCVSLTNIDGIGEWNTGNVSDMHYMFIDTNLSDASPLGTWDTGKVENAMGMFNGCENLTDISGLSGWNTSSMEDISGMFYLCSSLETAYGISNWDTGNVTSMCDIFEECTKLKRLDISGWNTGAVTNMAYMFEGSTALQEINLGSDFSFSGNNITDEEEKALLPTPSGSSVTGKWIREDGAFGPFTAEELRDNYTSVMSGKWIWEQISNKFTIHYIAPEGASGSMTDQEQNVTEDAELKANVFKRFNYHFDHWQGDDGNTYTDGQVIPANTFEAGTTLTLTAVMVKNDNKATFAEGVAEFILHGGEKLTFPELPGGTRYQIWEETPSGWQLIDQKDAAGTVPANGTADAEFTNEYVPGTTTVQLIATKTMDGLAPEEGAFTFQLKKDGKLVQEASNNASGVVMFDTLVFKTPGEYTYTISEVRGDDEGIRYDAHEETVTIVVTDDGQGNLTASTSYDIDGAAFENETKPGTLTVKKQTDGNGDPDEEFTFRIRLTNELGKSLDSVVITTDRNKS